MKSCWWVLLLESPGSGDFLVFSRCLTSRWSSQYFAIGWPQNSLPQYWQILSLILFFFLYLGSCTKHSLRGLVADSPNGQSPNMHLRWI